MGYKNPEYDMATAIYQLISGELTVPVYKTDVPAQVNEHHVIVRSESSSPLERNKHAFVTTCTVLVEVVTVFNAAIDESVSSGITNDINGLLMPTPNSYGITTDYKISDITVSSNNVIEDDGTNKYLTKINRYEISLNQ